MTPSERANEIKALLQLNYDMAERIVKLNQHCETKTLRDLYTEVESAASLLDKALKEAIYGS